MRTTVNLDEDVMRAVRGLSRERGESLGSVISSLVREALRPQAGVGRSDGLPVFEVPDGAPLITPEMVAEALEDH